MGFDPATLHSYVSLLVFNCFILQENERKVIIRTESVIKKKFSFIILVFFMLFCCSQKRNRNQSEIDLQLLLSLLQLFSQINFGLSFFLLVILTS
ncbi:hypothetical protein FZC11_01175 [Enterococcus faecium]|nr:hypothetical protein [Enterococcus faecium]